MERIKNRAMRRANELTTARIIIDRHPCVGTGPFTRYKIAIRQVEQYTPLTIGWIGKVLRAVLWLGGIANHRPRMRRWRWCWCWRLRRLRGRLVLWVAPAGWARGPSW